MKKKLLILVAFCLIISAPIQKKSAQDTEHEVMNIDNNDLEENAEKKEAEVANNEVNYKSSEKDKKQEEDFTEDEDIEKQTFEAVEETEKLDAAKNNYALSPLVGKNVIVKNDNEFKNAFNDTNVTEIKIHKEAGQLSIVAGQLQRTNDQPLTIDSLEGDK